MIILKKYLWLLPALYVAYEFANKLFEVISDPQEFIEIISVVIPNQNLAYLLAYGVGIWDMLIAVLIILIPLFVKNKKYITYLFIWVSVWPLVPASMRYFGGVADFEIQEVTFMMLAALASFALYSFFGGNNEK